MKTWIVVGMIIIIMWFIIFVGYAILKSHGYGENKRR